MRDKTADLSLLKDSQAETGVCTPKNLKSILQRKKPRSISKSLNQNEHKRGSFESPTKSTEVFLMLGFDRFLFFFILAQNHVLPLSIYLASSLCISDCTLIKNNVLVIGSGVGSCVLSCQLS